jgi:hypothetical protein
MEKVGRNDSCPCGSGKKFKRCCLEQVEKEGGVTRLTAERDRLLAEGEIAGREGRELAALKRAAAEAVALKELERRSESVLDLIKAGRIEDAETAARQLVVEFPEDAVVIERLGQVYEAKGAELAAADEYRRGVGLMDAAGDGQFCDCCRARLVKAIRRLDPDHPAPPLGRDPQWDTRSER